MIDDLRIIIDGLRYTILEISTKTSPLSKLQINNYTWLTVNTKSRYGSLSGSTNRQGSVSNKGQMKFNFSTATNSTISTTLFIELENNLIIRTYIVKRK